MMSEDSLLACVSCDKRLACVAAIHFKPSDFFHKKLFLYNEKKGLQTGIG
jgi:hypothetical protein